MTRLNLLLLALLLLSCLYLVRTAYESRRLFALLDNSRNEQRSLDIEFKRLDTERQAQAMHARVDKTARDKLKMFLAKTPAHYVDEGAFAAVPSTTTGTTITATQAATQAATQSAASRVVP